MKKNLLFGMITLLAGPLMAAASPKDDVQTAATALGAAANYTWQSTVDLGANSQFQPGPTDGKTEMGGYTTLSTSFNDNTSEGVLKGTNGAVKSDTGWQTLAAAMSDAAGGGGFNPSTMVVRQLQNLKTPAVEVTNLLGQVKELKKDARCDFRRHDRGRREGAAGHERRQGRGHASDRHQSQGHGEILDTDGKLVKYQVHITGTVSRNGNDRDVDRTTTTVIKEVGTTKITVADEVKKILP